jgi:hypothetical protein
MVDISLRSKTVSFSRKALHLLIILTSLDASNNEIALIILQTICDKIFVNL